MKKLQLYEVKFQVGLSSADRYNKWRYKPYNVMVIASDLDEVINEWTKKLLSAYPYEEGSGGSHYYTDPVYGDMFKFLSIELKEEEVLWSK